MLRQRLCTACWHACPEDTTAWGYLAPFSEDEIKGVVPSSLLITSLPSTLSEKSVILQEDKMSEKLLSFQDKKEQVSSPSFDMDQLNNVGRLAIEL